MSEQLQEFMKHLYWAGMSRDDIIRMSYDFAVKSAYENAFDAQEYPIKETAIMQNAAIALRDASMAVGLSREQMQEGKQ